METSALDRFTVEHSAHRVPDDKRAEMLAAPGFGKYLTDHMVTIRYSAAEGWHDAKIGPRQDFSLNPSTMVLHYAGEIFEGMKAYPMPDGGGALFRPQENARRFNASAERLAMAKLPEDLFVDAVRELVRIDRDWIPTGGEASLYMRPFMIGTEIAIGNHPSDSFLFAVIASPVGSYFKGGVSGVSVWVSENYTRAAPGGTGAAKCGGNYAAALAAQKEGAQQGCEQVLFLDAVERRWVEELAGMNVFFVFDDGSIQTPPLTGTILPGITRNSLIALARDQGMTVREEPYAIDQWRDDVASGRLVEVFACGTAAVVAPIAQLKGRDFDISIGDGGMGPVTAQLRKALTDIQFGRADDPHGWVDRVF
ncbi:branched-chain amino acid aminotransferase [Paracoccus sediminicola]|uniref:branched-chain amino acid aminotransferase n=1 Tax=Paracoccus sediminicola TaxID=3017783 RepID=UPI0022F0F694|nr:branched-chain amino acid aminotransferase [Paracoccus sediminicola]WBU58153.1 branched-chain amino acid aminotransferase [Paracoccus sediminicola]